MGLLLGRESVGLLLGHESVGLLLSLTHLLPVAAKTREEEKKKSEIILNVPLVLCACVKRK